MKEIKEKDKLFEAYYTGWPKLRLRFSIYDIWKVNPKSYNIKIAGGKCNWRIKKSEVGVVYFPSRRAAYKNIIALSKAKIKELKFRCEKPDYIKILEKENKARQQRKNVLYVLAILTIVITVVLMTL